MSQNDSSVPPLFSQVDVSPNAGASVGGPSEGIELLREVLSAQDRTNELLQELLSVATAPRQQKASELKNWKEANPALAKSCHQAAEALSRVQVEYLDRITGEINETADDMIDGEFVFNEFVDRFGPRLAHLNGVIQVLAQLSAMHGAGGDE